MTSKKEQFLKDVLHEIHMLMEHASPEELERLDLSTFDPSQGDKCIYGQMTGICTSIRAKELMDKACIRVMDLSTSGVKQIQKVDIDSNRFNINGEYKGQTWNNPGVSLDQFKFARNWGYLSALEAYICTKNANIVGIISYMKGETGTLSL